MKILIIEDNTELLDDMIKFLSNYGYLCVSSNNYEQALEKINIYDY